MLKNKLEHHLPSQAQSNNFPFLIYWNFFGIQFCTFKVSISKYPILVGEGVPELMLSIQPFCVHTFLGGWGVIVVADNAKNL